MSFRHVLQSTDFSHFLWGPLNAPHIRDGPGGEEEVLLIPVQFTTSPMCPVRQPTQRRRPSR